MNRLEEILKEMKKINDNYCTETGHIKADSLLCESLIILGQEDLVKAYYDVDKWYS